MSPIGIGGFFSRTEAALRFFGFGSGSGVDSYALSASLAALDGEPGLKSLEATEMTEISESDKGDGSRLALTLARVRFRGGMVQYWSSGRYRIEDDETETRRASRVISETVT